MKSNVILKLLAIGGMALALFAGLSLTQGTKRGVVSAANPPAPLLSCPIVSGNSTNTVSAADILLVVRHFGQNYGTPGAVYWPLYDVVSPYDPADPLDPGGKITAADILLVVTQFAHVCPLVDTQIAKATRAIGDPLFSDVLCDDAGTVKYQNPVNCGGDTRFFTEDPSFLAGKGYLRGSTDVPGQGVHYVNYSYWNGVFNPVRPPGLVYKGGALVAQLYYVAGDSGATIGGTAGVGWGSALNSNVRAVNIDALCTPVPQEPPSIGACSWAGSYDGFHWHQNLCTVGIGTPGAIAFPGVSSQSSCNSFGASQGISCTFPPAANFNCAWSAAVGWMGHLWNWLPNSNYTNAVNPGPGGLGDCTALLCATGESNGRFADCAPDISGWNAYNCPQ